MVHQIVDLDEFKAKVLNDTSGKLIVVDFWATWCGPCIHIAPIVDKIAGENTDVAFYKVDVDANSATSQNVGIRCMPTFKFYKNGVVLEGGTMEGASEQGLKDKVAEFK